MADVIAAHAYAGPEIEDHPTYGYTDVAVCDCGARLYLETLGEPNDRDDLHAAHVAEELTKAGYGNVQEALLAAADEMPIESLLGADKASVWLRQRAHSIKGDA